MPSIVKALNTTKASPVCTAGIELEQGISSSFSKEAQVTSQLVRNGSSVAVGSLHGYREAGGWLATTRT